MSAIETLKTFNKDDLPDLDTVVAGALELFSVAKLPKIEIPLKRPLVVGSANAEYAGRIVFGDTDAVFADESSFEDQLATVPEIDGAVVVSASGSKHAIEIAKTLKNQNIPAWLFTCNEAAPAREFFDDDKVLVFPKNREPYTYNTSTYLGMILAKTKEDPRAIRAFIDTHISTSDLLPTLSASVGFTFVLPSDRGELRYMLRTKFDELFGIKVPGRFFTAEEFKHAKSVVRDPGELFVNMTERSLGIENELRLSLPDGYGGALATTYYLVGLIQRSKPPYFKDNITRYCQEASAVFNSDIPVIVD
jgi:hypothetical protein